MATAASVVDWAYDEAATPFNKVAFDAVPVKLPVKLLEVTEVNPAKLKYVPPSSADVEPIVVVPPACFHVEPL